MAGFDESFRSLMIGAQAKLSLKNAAFARQRRRTDEKIKAKTTYTF